MRWERHWWQKTEPIELLRTTEPTVWVDPELYEERAPSRRLAQGTVPPPSCVGPFCSLEADNEVTQTGPAPEFDV